MSKIVPIKKFLEFLYELGTGAYISVKRDPFMELIVSLSVRTAFLLPTVLN